MKCLHRKSGFTLPELMISLTISIMVFSAMGMILSRCFSLWMDSMAHWKMAQHARISRARILHGGFADPSGGLLSATDIKIVEHGSAINIGYETLHNSYYGICVYTNVPQPRMYLIDQKTIEPFWVAYDHNDWAWGVKLGKKIPVPEVEVTHMSAARTSDVLTMNYTLQLKVAGRTFTQPQTIRAFMINYEE